MCYSELFWGYFFRNTTKWADGKLHSLQKRFSFDDTLFIFLYRLARLIRYFSEFAISCVWEAVKFRYFLVHYQSGHFRINVVITEGVGKWMDGWVSKWVTDWFAGRIIDLMVVCDQHVNTYWFWFRFDLLFSDKFISFAKHYFYVQANIASSFGMPEIFLAAENYLLKPFPPKSRKYMRTEK